MKAGTIPKINISNRPRSTVFFLPINLITPLLRRTKIVIIIAGIVAKLSTEARPILGLLA